MNSQDVSTDLTGQTLCDYQIQRRLGRGGMADVYLAKQFSLQRNVALKILKPELARDQSYVKRFHLEAQSAAALVQTNIVQIFEVGQCEGLHYIAQEYVNGRNLRQYLDRHGAIEGGMAVNLLLQSGRALQRAAEFGVVHRDIKPENILLSTTGEIKIADFGLARVINNPNSQSLTQVGITMGTPLYMSPEQVEGKELDSRSDIYSLGVTLYHTLAGRPPFEGETALAIAFKQVKDQAIPLKQIRPDLPEELCQLIASMMAKSPGDRPQDPAALLKEARKIKVDSQENWDSLSGQLLAVDGGLDSATLPLAQSRLAATQQLQKVMQGKALSDPFEWWKKGLLLVGLSLAAVGVGTLLARQSVPRFPLAEVEARNDSVPRKSSIQQQYFAASVGSGGGTSPQRKVDLWKAVIDYFPLKEAQQENITLLYHRRAKVRLGEVFLQEGELRRAYEIYDELEKGAAEEIYRQFQVIGYAGKLIVYFRSEDIAGGEAQQQEKISRHLELIGDDLELLNPWMREEVRRIRDTFLATHP